MCSGKINNEISENRILLLKYTGNHTESRIGSLCIFYGVYIVHNGCSQKCVCCTFKAMMSFTLRVASHHKKATSQSLLFIWVVVLSFSSLLVASYHVSQRKMPNWKFEFVKVILLKLASFWSTLEHINIKYTRKHNAHGFSFVICLDSCFSSSSSSSTRLYIPIYHTSAAILLAIFLYSAPRWTC